MAETYHVLHASDFHISKVPYSTGRAGARPPLLSRLKLAFSRFKRFKLVSHDDAVLRAFAQFLYKYAHEGQKFDLVALTGDLATTGYDTDLKQAHEFLESRVADWVKLENASHEPTISFANALVELLPGNHDRYRRNASPRKFCKSGGTRFNTIFNAYWSVGQGAQPWRIIQKVGQRPLALAAADLTLERGDDGKRVFFLPGYFGQGRVRTDARSPLQSLRGVTTRLRDECRYKYGSAHPVLIWAIHFDPSATDELLKLLDSDYFIHAAAEDGVAAVLCGHTHDAKVKPLSEVTTAYVCGTTSQACTSSTRDHSTTVHDCQMVTVDAPEASTEAPDVEVTWYRYHVVQGKFLELPRHARVY